MNAILAGALAACLTVQSPPGATTGADPVVGKAQAALAAMAAGDFAVIEAQFTPAVAKAVPAGRLAAIWISLSEQLGSYGGCGGAPRVLRISDKQMVISSCRFGPAGIDIQFAYDPSGRISGLNFRPAARSGSTSSAVPFYADTGAYSEEEVTIGSAWALPGTLALPTAEGKHPAIVFVGGSGPGDRDAGIGPNRPFRDLAVRGVSRRSRDRRGTEGRRRHDHARRPDPGSETGGCSEYGTDPRGAGLLMARPARLRSPCGSASDQGADARAAGRS